MKKLISKIKAAHLGVLCSLFILSACNKELEQLPVIIVPTAPSGAGIAGAIAANPDDSLYYRLMVKSGLVPTLNNNANSYTMFVPDNNGMRLFLAALSGGVLAPGTPDAVLSGFITSNIPAASAAAIVSYNTVGQKFPSSSFPTVFPNFPLPTLIVLDPTQPFVRMPIFPSKQTPVSYVNNIPLIGVDQVASNGIIHHTYTIVAPPSATLRTVVAAEPTLSYFRAALLRADSASKVKANNDSTEFLNYLLGYGVTNMTVLAPNDAAFQAVVYGTAYGYALSLGAPPAIADAQAQGAVALGPGIFSNAAFYGILPASSVRGILAYHILASNTTGAFRPDIRAFSVNFSSTPTPVKTLVNASVGVHPGIMAMATFTGPAVTELKFTGLGTFPPGGAPFSGAPAVAVAMDKHGVNGVLHIIDKVLFPQ